MSIYQHKSEEIAHYFASLPQVAAVALGGSQSSRMADPGSDLDLYIYTESQISPEKLIRIIEQCGGAVRSELNLPYWGGVNMWIDRSSGITVDCVYFDARWMEEQVSRVMDAYQPSLGYSTCFCRTVAQSQILYDRRAWLAELQSRCLRDYPEPLQGNIIRHNHPALRTILSSYLHQIENAARRGDAVSVNHRVAALLASYFDILFALNRVLHPGEKRLVMYAYKECALLPAALEEDIGSVLMAAAGANINILLHLNRLLDRLDELLAASGFAV